MLTCPNGHEVRPGVKFCKTCGSLMEDQTGPVTPDSAAAPPDRSEAEQQADVAPSAARSKLRRFSVIALTTVSLVGIGVVIGWVVLSRWLTPAPENSELVQVPVSQFLAAEGDAVVMPDVRGLSEASARTVLADAGIRPDVVTVKDQPSAGPEGIVVSQDPAFGTTPVQAVVLARSAAAAVPDVAGQRAAEAQAVLAALGTRVAVNRRYVPGTEPGIAIATDPSAGAALPESITLVISEAPGSVFLDQLSTVDGSRSCSSGEAIVDGKEYANSLQCSAQADPEEYVWLLGRKVETFEAVIGVPDDGEQSARVDVTVLADGAPVAQGTAAFGDPLKVTASVSGAIQLQVRVRAGSVDPDSYDDVPVVLADARLIGSTDAIAELAGWGTQ